MDFILPMRNWNGARDRFNIVIGGILSYLWGIETMYHLTPNERMWKRFYLTYEELKHARSNSFSYCSYDFILPMRNWNVNNIARLFGFKLILSYLWGIETIFLHGVEGIHASILSYLWGIETSDNSSNCVFSVRILSYLWGIETHYKLRKDYP